MGNLSNIAPRCKVGYFLCTEYIFIELATTFALVVCGIARSSAGGSFRSNQSQIVSVRYSFVISAGVANIVRTVIVSRFVLFVVATRTFMPVVSIIRLPFCACGMSGSRNLHTGFIGNFYRSCCICEPLVTAIAGVVCGIARSSAGGSFRSNQSQIVSVFFVFIFVIICNNRSVRNNRLIQAVNLYKFIIIKCFCRC